MCTMHIPVQSPLLGFTGISIAETSPPMSQKHPFCADCKFQSCLFFYKSLCIYKSHSHWPQLLFHKGAYLLLQSNGKESDMGNRKQTINSKCLSVQASVSFGKHLPRPLSDSPSLDVPHVSKFPLYHRK